MYNLGGKIVLVTGASSGIGQATAIEFAKKGSIVIINYCNNKEGALQTQESISMMGGKSHILQCDVADDKQIDNMFDKIIEKYGTLDVLINNAGVIGPWGDFETIDIHKIKDLMNVNLIGPMYCTQKIVGILKSQNKKGVILNTASVHGNHDKGGATDVIPYCVSKGGLINFTSMIARQLGPDIRVNAIGPGPVTTPIWDEDDDITLENYRQMTLIERFINPIEIAHGFIFLAENEAMTGETIYIDGGFRS